MPGREPRTRDEHEHRLQVLAGAVAAASDDWQRQMQLHRQFRKAAAWAKRSSAPPTMADLWVDALASPSCLARPRPLDFDPDPQARRRRTALPPHVRADPWSIPNILHALRAASLKVRVARSGDPPHDAGHLQVDMPIKGRSRFMAIAQRDIHGRMAWRWVWDGNHSKAGLARHRRALRCDAYARMVEVLRHGRRGVQADLFCRPG